MFTACIVCFCKNKRQGFNGFYKVLPCFTKVLPCFNAFPVTPKWFGPFDLPRPKIGWHCSCVSVDPKRHLELPNQRPILTTCLSHKFVTSSTHVCLILFVPFSCGPLQEKTLISAYHRMVLLVLLKFIELFFPP